MGTEALLLLSLLAATASASPARTTPPPPQQSPGPFTEVFTLHVENDSIRPGASDNSYTQGMELRVGLKGDKPLRLLPIDWAWRISDDDQVVSGRSAQIGQTIFTPHNIITYLPRAEDRPFGAFLYVGAESVRVRRDHLYPETGGVLRPRRLVFSANVGLIGTAAGGRISQSAFHVLRENRMAKGWLVSQLPNQLQINFRLANEHIVLSTADLVNTASEGSFLKKWGSFFDLTLMEEAVLGTAQTYAGIGGTVRLGRGLSSLPNGVVAFSAADSTTKAFEISARAGGRFRGMLRNAFISGPFGHSTGHEITRGLKEWHVGFEVRWHEWRFSYIVVTRGNEIRELAAGLPREHSFAAIGLARESGPWGAHKKEFRRIASGTRLNLRLGRAKTSITPDGPVSHKPSLAASWGLEHALPLSFSIAWEKTGATREGGPPVGGVHTDQFLLANAFTLAWETPSKTSRHKLQVRAGGGPALAKYQVTPDTGTLDEPEPVSTIEKGKNWLGGVRYSFRIAVPVSLTFDVARSRLTIDKAIVTRANFTSFTFGIQIHPWRRDSGDID